MSAIIVPSLTLTGILNAKDIKRDTNTEVISTPYLNIVKDLLVTLASSIQELSIEKGITSK